MHSKQGSNKSKDQLKTFLIYKQNGKNTISLQNSKVSDQNQIPTNKETKDVRIEAKQKDKEIQAITSIHQTEQKVKKDLQEMIEEYKNEAEKMMINHGHDPEKQAEIRHHLKKLQQEKKQRRIRFQKDLKRLEQKKQDVNQSSSMNQAQKIQRRKSIEKRIEKIKERQKKRQEQEANFAKFYSEFKAIKPLHKQLEEEYNQKVEKEEEQKVMRVKREIKEKVKPMDLQKLSEFEEKYMSNKYQIEKLRLQNKLMEKKREEANMQQLNQLYKGHCHSLVLEQLAEKNQKANYSYQKRKRIKEYSQIVRQEYKPHTVRNSIETQENQSEQNMIPQTQRGKRVVKDRYLKGQYQGKMVTYQKVPLSHNQQIHKGIQYLQFLKSLPKKPKKVELTTITPQIKPKAEVFKVKKPENPLYRNSRRYKSIDFNLKDADTESVGRVMQFMRFRRQQLKDDQKLLKNANPKNRREWQANQKSYDTQLVSNIQEKLQILKKL